MNLRNPYRLAASAAFFTGITIIVLDAIAGNSELYLLVIIPVIKSSSLFSLLGFGLVFVSFILFFLSFTDEGSAEPTREGNTRKETHGIVLIGPVPVYFSGDKRYLPYIILTGLIFFIIMFIFFIFYF